MRAALPHEAALRALFGLLARTGTAGAVIGGVAASLLGAPRFTADVDALLLLDADGLEGFLKAARRSGFEPRLADAAAFARKRRVLLLRHRPSGVGVDLALGALPFEAEAVRRAVAMRAGALRLRVVRPEDLIVMKAVASRSRDWEDIRRIADAGHSIRWRRVMRIVREFAHLLERPEITQRLEQVHRSARRRPATATR